MSRSMIAWLYRVSLPEHSRLSFALIVVCRSLSLSPDDAINDRQWEVQALSARFHAGAYHRCKVAKESFHL
jgi:hypothetical protein